MTDLQFYWERCGGHTMGDFVRAEERIQMWASVTAATHPFFGRTRPTPEEALKAGIEAGQRGRFQLL